MIRAPVRFEMEPERIGDVQALKERGPVENTRMLVARGMRAQLQSANLLTGQMQVALTIVPDAAPAEMRVEGDVLVLPTVPGQFAGMAVGERSCWRSWTRCRSSRSART